PAPSVERRMVADAVSGNDPGDAGKRPSSSLAHEIRHVLDVPRLTVRVYVLEVSDRLPHLGRIASGVVLPAHPGLVEEVGYVRPRVVRDAAPCWHRVEVVAVASGAGRVVTMITGDQRAAAGHRVGGALRTYCRPSR